MSNTIKKCKSNPDCNDCNKCMQGSPFKFCCRDECKEHEFCRTCDYVWKHHKD